MTQVSQFRYLELNMNENREASIFRMEKAWTLQFVLGPSLADKNVRVFVNHPLTSSEGSHRDKYLELHWENLSSLKSDVYDNFAECHLVIAGSFNYYFTINGSDKVEDANGSGYFLVDPILHIGDLDDRLSMDSIRCQTVIAKCLGPFDEWKGRLIVAKETGYNMIHFTPVQELGLSNSSYCIKNHLKLNPVFSSADKVYTMKDVESLVQMMKNKWNVLSLTDLVYNHTANESPWLLEHPECSYNMINSPHLKPAYLVDRILWHFNLEVGEGKWANHGIPRELRTEEQLQSARLVLLNSVFPKHRIAEFFLVHIDEMVAKFKSAVLSGVRGDDRPYTDIEIIHDPNYRRLKATINIAAAVKKYYSSQPDTINRDQKISNACNSVRQRLVELNDATVATINGHIECAVNNYLANGRWRFIDLNGPRVPAVSEKEPIMWNYFTLPTKKMTLEQEEEMMHGPEGAFCMAHNGWVMSDDPLRNFAEPGSNIYLRRELIPWGDNVKLRYGSSPSDCPFLWDYMRQYTVEAARIFHGVRLDNCHSTPVKVAEFMLDEARKVRSDLYVIAELFTSSEYMDNIFINRLGLNSLIREGLNAHSCTDLGRLVHRFGGSPVGSFMQPPQRPLMPTMAHAMFLDQTHDNESPINRRSPYDVFPSSALIAMTCSATGSNRGYDEMIPHHINVVTEERLYRSWSENGKTGPELVTSKDGIIAAKKAINILHYDLSRTGFDQIFVDQLAMDTCAVTRHNSVSHQSVIVIARTAFSMPEHINGWGVPNFKVPGLIDEIIFEGRTTSNGSKEFVQDKQFINGLANYMTTVREHIKVSDSEMIRILPSSTNEQQDIEFHNFTPGSVIAIRVSLNATVKAALLQVRQLLAQFGYRMRTFSARTVEEIKGGEVAVATEKLTLNDLNRILYRCDPEEKDDGKGFGAYHLDNFGNMTYCGLQGIMSIMNKIRAGNELGHPLCENLRSGHWLLDYTANRLLAFTSTKEIGLWLESAFSHLRKAPSYLIPCYFDALTRGVCAIAEEMCWKKMSRFIEGGSMFVRQLSLGSVQMCSYMQTALLPPISSEIAKPLPPIDPERNIVACLSLSAGLPHFSCGIFRNWGRDTFIAMRGLLLLTGRLDDARFLILGYGGTLRHGLIPNLLGSGTSARYNCRDAVWFFLKCIEDYCKTSPSGLSILKDKVIRLYPSDNSEAQLKILQPLEDIIQETLQRHSDGVHFRERNAGNAIDNHMRDEGFNNVIGVDWNTGFVFGGNVHNCGTWMDKMGSSEKAGNYGRPATPRDGSAVELIGLCASVVKWLSELSAAGQYPHTGVQRTVMGVRKLITFKEWYELIKENFEKHYWINTSPVDGEVRPDLINRRGIYKDTLNSKTPWTDYQLRPNFPIAMCVAPDLFDPEHAWVALEIVENILMGTLGIKTLDPSDHQYDGNYINSDDSNNFKTARGFNYHQGPEWVWPVGFFMRAKLLIAARLEPRRPGLWAKAVNYVKLTMTAHRMHLFESDWKSLPELTNANGAVCQDSCMAQAWSVGCLLEALYDMEQLSQKMGK